MQASELSAAATTVKANQSAHSMNVDVDVLTSAYQPMQAVLSIVSLALSHP